MEFVDYTALSAEFTAIPVPSTPAPATTEWLIGCGLCLAGAVATQLGYFLNESLKMNILTLLIIIQQYVGYTFQKLSHLENLKISPFRKKSCLCDPIWLVRRLIFIHLFYFLLP